MSKEQQEVWVGLDVGKKDFYAAIDKPGDRRLVLDKLPSRKFKRSEVGAGALLK